MQTVVSPLSYVHPRARLGANVVIEPFASVHEDVEIGDGSIIRSNAVIYDGARLGRECQVYPSAVISSIPQDLKYKGEYTTTELGDRVTVREFATINRGTAASHRTVIKSNALIMAYSHVAHDCVIGENAILANGVNLAGHILVDDWAIVGGVSAVHQFVRIGKHAMVAANSLVLKDVPPFTLAGRTPLAYKGINYRGLTRRGFSQETVQRLQEAYRLVFLSGLNLSSAIARIQQDFPDTSEMRELLDFLSSTERGLCKGYHAHDKHPTNGAE